MSGVGEARLSGMTPKVLGNSLRAKLEVRPSKQLLQSGAARRVVEVTVRRGSADGALHTSLTVLMIRPSPGEMQIGLASWGGVVRMRALFEANQSGFSYLLIRSAL